MAEKIYLYLFILCVILFQGIIGVFSEDLGKPRYSGESNFLTRKKRVINLEAGGDIAIQRRQAPFVVNIGHTPYDNNTGVGAILSKHTVITAAVLVTALDLKSIQVLSGSTYSNRGNVHTVIAKDLKFGIHQHSEFDGIALLTVTPAFSFGINVNQIALHTGPVLPGTLATIFGWGYKLSAECGTQHPSRLRSITVPIMRHQECVEIYQNRYVITDKDICTYHANKRCGHTDVGAPLVVDNHLAGFYLRTGARGRINPDVFLFIQHLEYSQWIRSKIVHDL